MSFLRWFRNTESASKSSRRGFLMKGLSTLTLGVLGKSALAEDASSNSRLRTDGDVLKTHVAQGKAPVEPLDTVVLWERSDNSTGRAMTHEILSLQHEERGNGSYPWTIYSHLTTHHVEGDACVLYAKMDKKNAGWSCGLHSEVFCEARAVGLGVNVEMTNRYNGPEKSEMIGVNILALGPYDCQYGMQIHDNKGHFETSIGLNGQGKTGIDFAGKFDTGIDMHDNNLRLNEGASICLEQTGKVRIRYKSGRIEILNDGRCVGHINVNGQDHEL